MRLSRKALIAFFALGFVSLFADITYEGARSVIGSYLEVLEASSLIVGLVSVGDLVGYLTRGLGGYIAGYSKSSGVYWGLVFAGYSINLFAVPALAFVGRWDLAFMLMILERVGKGLRAPARDTILAEVTEGIGKGKGFALHEVMDQIGAVAGPIFVGWSLYTYEGDYSIAFKMLFIPAILALVMLTVAFLNHRRVRAVEETRKKEKMPLGKAFWAYTLSMGLLAAGFIHWALVAYHVKLTGIISDHDIAYIYTVAMLVDAFVALPAGFLYDRIGPKTLVVAPPLAAIAVAYFLRADGLASCLAASALWGALMGIYETNMRVTVADVVPKHARAYAYGMYGMTFGLAWAAGNGLMGFMYGTVPEAIIPYVLVMQGASMVSLLFFLKLFNQKDTVSE